MDGVGPSAVDVTGADVQGETFGVVGVGPAPADVYSTDLPMFPITLPGLAAEVTTVFRAYFSLLMFRRKLMAWLVWGPLLLMLTVLTLPWFLSGSLLWVVVCLLSPAQHHLTRISLNRYRTKLFIYFCFLLYRADRYWRRNLIFVTLKGVV